MTTEARSANLNGRTRMGFLNISGKIFPLYEGLNTVGRSKNATVMIKNANVSQHHALITIVNETQHFVSDLQSVNGTTLKKNKLQPMLLYKISNNSIINFANEQGLYKMVSNQLHSTTEYPSINNQQQINSQNTQNLNDSFFVAKTQVLNNTNTENTNVNNSLHCFEDDFNFSDIPSPPVCEISNIEETDAFRKPELTIHELPTQIIELNTENFAIPNKNQIPSTSKGSETKMDIHDLPTQRIEFDLDNEAYTKNNSLHSQPTQKIDNDECDKEAHIKDNSLHSQSTQLLINETIDQDTSIKSEKPPDKNVERLANDTVLDIIDETVLDDSGLDKTLQSVNISEQNDKPSVLQEEIPQSPNSDSSSQLQVQHLYRRTLKPITDDTEEEMTNSGSDVVKIDPKSVNKKPLPESSPENSEEEICKLKSKRKARQIVSDESDSETTDIEDGLDSKRVTELEKNNANITASNENDESGSETDIDDIDVQEQLKKLNSSESKGEAEIENTVQNVVSVVFENKVEQLLKDDVNIEQSDSDSDYFDVDIKSKSGDNSTNQKLFSDNSDIIPTTQASEDEDDDFNFVPKNNSTLISNKNTNQTEDQVFDVSQKLKELRKFTVTAQSCTEESIHLYLSGSTEDHEKNKKNSEQQNNEDDDKTPDISDVEDNDNPKENINKKETENIFDQPTQMVHDIDTNINKSAEKDDSIFSVATQKINEVNAGDNEFQKPSSSVLIKRKKATQDMSEDNSIFMQPTQVITNNNKNTQKEDDDAIFMLPTQKYTNSQNVSKLEDKEDNEIFDQPTQAIVINNDKPDDDLNEKCENDDEEIFMQPTQKYPKGNQNVLKEAELNDSEIFKLPTQIITKDNKKSPSKNYNDNIVNNLQDTARKSIDVQDDDVFNQPTQVIRRKEIEKTQIITKDNKKSPFENSNDNVVDNLQDAAGKSINVQDDDVFNQPTQVIRRKGIENSSSKQAKQSLSLHKDKKERTKFDEVESQLEVMFASQTLKLSSQMNDRPLNPLVNVFDGKNNTESQENNEQVESKEHDSSKSSSTKEYCETSTLPVDELTDQSNSKKTETNNVIPGRSVRKRKVTETVNPVEVVETPKKRSMRNKGKATAQEPSSKKNAGNKVKNETEINNEEKENVTSTGDSENVSPIEKQGNEHSNEEVEVKDSKSRTRASTKNKEQVIQKNIKKNTKEIISETDKNETSKGTRTSKRKQKAELKNIEVETSNLPNTSPSTSKVLADADANLELTPENIKPKTINTRSTRKKGMVVTSAETTEPVVSTPTRVSKRNKRLVSTEDENKPDIAAKRIKRVEIPSRTASPSGSSNDSDFTISTPSTRSKRILSKDNEKRKSNPSTKKAKKIKTPTSEEASTNSENSNTSIDATPKRSKQQLSSLNITSSTAEKSKRILKPKVVFTMLNSPELESRVRSLGGIVVDSVSACTVLVTGTLKRTQKLLSAVGHGKPICSPEWLKECKKANKFLDPWDYLLEDEEAERNWNLSLRESLERSKDKKLLEEYTVVLAVTEAVDVLKEAVESCGGKCVAKVPAKNTKSNLVVVGNPNKKASYARFLKQNPPVTVIAPEAIFDGVLRQELRFQNHLLT